MKINILFIALLFCTFISCAQNKTSNTTFCVAFYNCENFYDIFNDPKVNDEEFLPQAKSNWDETKFNNKKTHLAKVISALNNAQAPDVIGLCEIENNYVLNELINDPQIKHHQYGIVQYNSADERGIDVALLYKKDVLEILGSKSYRIKMPFDTNVKTRDILVVKGKLKNGQINYFFVNHFPSRRSGTTESEPKRMFVAQFERNIIDSVYDAEKNNKVGFIAMGDFNDEPNDKSLQLFEKGKIDLVNTFTYLKNKKEGTHFYKGEWSMFDQIFVSENIISCKAKICADKEAGEIFKPEFLLEQTPGLFFGAPLRTFAGNRYLGGYSDHLPVSISLHLK